MRGIGGKHTADAVKIRQLKDKEIKDIKRSLADKLQEIRNYNEGNDLNDPEQRKRKISEMCTDTIYELRIDELDEFFEKEKAKAKIIELPTTRKVINSSIKKHL